MENRLNIVEEDDCISAHQLAFNSHAAIELRFRLGLNKSLEISKRVIGIPGAKVDVIQFSNFDIDGMIDFLQKAKTTVEQAEVCDRLSGR